MSDRLSKLRVFTAERIHTMDDGRPLANAVAVADGRIVSVGTIESMQPWLRRIEHEIDDRYADRVIMPGFIDPHTHLRGSGSFAGLNYVGPIDLATPGALAPLATRDAVLDRIRDLVAATATDEDGSPEPVLCWGYDPATQGGHLDRDVLDRISDTVPIWVCAYAPHIVYTNTPMLELTGVDDDSTMHGIGRYPDGRLNGWFIESTAVHAAITPVASLIYREGFGRRALARMGTVARGAGITASADMGWGFQDFDSEWDDHRAAIDGGDLPLRMTLVPFDSSLSAAFGDEAIAFLEDRGAAGDDRLRTRGVKFINDGSYPSMTLMLGFPGYLDGEHGLTGPTPWDEVYDRMLPYWRAGVPIHSHANGDATVAMTLDVLARLQAAHPRFDHRFTIEHYSLSTPADARRLAALGGLASVNPYFVALRAQMHADVGFGPDRSEATARLGSLLRAGAPFALHSDYNLVVGPMQPLLAAQIAVTRLGADNETVLAPGERIGVHDALRAITVDAAYVLGSDDRLGSIEVGKFADFAVLADDPYQVDPTELGSIEVIGTVVDGEPTQST